MPYKDNQWIPNKKEDPYLKIINERMYLIDKITALGFFLGVLIGIVLASFLHKYIVHPFGW